MFRTLRTALPVVALLAGAGCAGDTVDAAPGAEDPRATESSAAAAPKAAPKPAPPERSAEGPANGTEPARSMPPRQAAGAAELARRLVAAEDDVRDHSVRGDALRAAAFETQVLYRQLARRDGWQRPVLAELPPRYRGLARLHVEAKESFRSMHRTLTDRVPAWRIATPAPRTDLLRLYRKAQRQHGVPWELLAAINMVESGFGRIQSDSVAGAQGPMQFIPTTWDLYGEGDVHDPHDAIMAAARLLADRGAAAGGVDDALFAYNNHPAYVAGIKAYAEILSEDPAALRGLHQWQVLYLADIGDLWLPEGFHRSRNVPADRYAAAHPRRHLSTDTR